MFKPCGARGGRPRLTLGHRPTGLLKAKPRFGSLQVLSVCFKANSSVREQRGKEPLFAAAGCPPLRGRRCSGPRRSAERVRRPPQCLGGGLPFSVSRLSFCSAASTWGHGGDIRGRPAARCPPSTPHPHSPSTRADATQPAPPATRQHPDRATGLPPTPSPHAGPRPRPGPGPLRPQLPRQLSPAP